MSEELTTISVGPLPRVPPLAQGVSRRRRAKDLVAVNIGNAIEWFDWNVYAIFAPFFAVQFFNRSDPLSAMLSTLAIFGVGFLMRPIGGWVFGLIADKRGRRFSLTLAILLAAAGSLIIALAPTFTQVGVLASAVLLMARLIQGLSHGGETGSAFTYLAEISPDGKRGLWASTPWVGVAIGTMTATGLGFAFTTLLTADQMSDFGWRIPFFVGAALGVYGLVIRFRMAESDVYEQQDESPHSLTLKDTWRILVEHRTAVKYIAILSTSGVAIFYTWFIFAPSYATTVHGVPPGQALLAGLLGQAVFLALIPVMGALSDRIGRRKMVFAYTLGFAALAFPLELILGSSAVRLFLAMAVASTILAVCCAPLGAIFTELVPTRVRATVVGITYGGFCAVFGGSAPYLNAWLSSVGLHYLFVTALVGLSLLTAVICRRMPETKGTPIR
ncbi:MFS transporter [Rhodococcus wratislaviensis]|uniref:MFS transporter n=1 Tax=Rhodococcus wratislaviensis TaxID=44752 RepID=UPI003518B687